MKPLPCLSPRHPSLSSGFFPQRGHAWWVQGKQGMTVRLVSCLQMTLRPCATCCAPLHMAPHGQVALDSPTSMAQTSVHLTRAFHTGLSCTHHLCYPMTPTHRPLGPSPAGRPPTGRHPSTYPTLRMMVVPMANRSLLLRPARAPAGAIGPETPEAPSQSPRSRVKA